MQTASGLNWVCKSTAKLPGIARQLLAEAGQCRVFAFYGDMGSGKTTFIKEICRQLGVSEVVTSPTFTIVNEYCSGTGEPIYHFDFYRIKSESEAFDLGYENYLYSGNYCFVEWPDRISSLLPLKFATVLINTKDEERIITLTL
ncbi:MAG: tRNA (adenosine(37)-N6)-threonylcarbamoyltransferase complex ATPase subunit type 1 TsaE [Bacteroidota bacterium]|nr:tRNA (adenosine(37)-N6)-threonylcarbamoyltransferase complex ATPase subunit type 1 TsaE [Bacteroidota bacterium]